MTGEVPCAMVGGGEKREEREVTYREAKNKVIEVVVMICSNKEEGDFYSGRILCFNVPV